ncbi:MAG: hypothetical protein FWD47_05715 [Treponema sp.]|nr:hypothetical protein [Treponema sp.]
MKTFKLSLFMILMTFLFISCVKQSQEVNSVQEQETIVTYRYDGIGLRLHTMIEWTEEAHSLYRRVFFGNREDIIIEVEDKTIFNDSGQYQYILFDYDRQQVIDIITVCDSSSPLVFYKSRISEILLLESYDGLHRYKYTYLEGVSAVDDAEFLSLFLGEYFSQTPHSNSYIINYERLESPDWHEASYAVDRSNMPAAWSGSINANYDLLDNLNARVFNSAEGYLTRPTDWKILDNKYVFMLNSNELSNPYGHRAYYVVRIYNNRLVFSIPQITAPYLKNEGDPIKALHDTLIDFSVDQKRVLIKGMYDDKLCLMIYDIVNYDDWVKTENISASKLTFGNSVVTPLSAGSRIDLKRYSVEPGTTTVYGYIGRINLDCNLYAEPDEKSRIIINITDGVMIRSKPHEALNSSLNLSSVEVLKRTETKSIVNGVEDYWYKIIFDSDDNYNYDPSLKYLPDKFTEYTGWIFGGDLKILDENPWGVIIQSNHTETY